MEKSTEIALMRLLMRGVVALEKIATALETEKKTDAVRKLEPHSAPTADSRVREKSPKQLPKLDGNGSGNQVVGRAHTVHTGVRGEILKHFPELDPNGSDDQMVGRVKVHEVPLRVVLAAFQRIRELYPNNEFVHADLRANMKCELYEMSRALGRLRDAGLLVRMGKGTSTRIPWRVSDRAKELHL